MEAKTFPMSHSSEFITDLKNESELNLSQSLLFWSPLERAAKLSQKPSGMGTGKETEALWFSSGEEQAQGVG